ncbi:hypothetical protein ASZ90_012280 [hydrocarbon metagenome]|uniref:Uncharacterized protein n=1 Tax=hydrocarbon metagenome TaxID=938273 RepID=A0A0W8FAX4_9ZZZZ
MSRTGNIIAHFSFDSCAIPIQPFPQIMASARILPRLRVRTRGWRMMAAELEGPQVDYV